MKEGSMFRNLFGRGRLESRLYAAARRAASERSDDFNAVYLALYDETPRDFRERVLIPAVRATPMDLAACARFRDERDYRNERVLAVLHGFDDDPIPPQPQTRNRREVA